MVSDRQLCANRQETVKDRRDLRYGNSKKLMIAPASLPDAAIYHLEGRAESQTTLCGKVSI